VIERQPVLEYERRGVEEKDTYVTRQVATITHHITQTM